MKLICSPWFAEQTPPDYGTVNVGVTRACKTHGWMRDSGSNSNTIALAGLYFSCTRKIHLVVRHTGLSLGTIASSCCRAHGYRVSFIVSAARIPAFASKTKSNYSHPPLRAFNCPRARPSHARAQNITLLFRYERNRSKALLNIAP